MSVWGQTHGLRGHVQYWTASGVAQGVLPFYDLTCTRMLNGFDVLEMAVDKTRLGPAVDQRLELMVGAPGVQRVRRENVFLLRGVNYDGGIGMLTAYDPTSLLDHGIVDYAADSSYCSKSGPIETLMKTVVDENFVSPTDTSRIISGMSVQADGGEGPTMAKSFARQQILPLLQTMNKFSLEKGEEIIFKVVETSGSMASPAFQFRTWVDRLKEASGYVFSEAGGGLRNPRLTYDYTEEVTVAVVGGTGDRATRLVERSSNAGRIAASPYNRIERFKTTNLSVAASMQNEGEQMLGEMAAKALFEADIVATEGCRYGIDWGLGSLVWIRAYGVLFEALVRKVTIKMGSERSISARVGALVEGLV